MNCKECNATWQAPNQTLTECPFCKVELPATPTVDPMSNEGKILAMVQASSVNIYNDSAEFYEKIEETFAGEEIARLIIKVIDVNGLEEICKLKECSPDTYADNYNKTLDLIAYETLIPRYIIAPAVELLCAGLGLATNALLKSTSEFEIKNNIITKYKGEEADIVIPNGVTTIWDKVFAGRNDVYGYNMYKALPSIITVKMPNSVTGIWIEAFYICSNLTTVEMSNTVTSIGEKAFFGCKSLTTINIPDSVTYIGDEAFFDCKLPIHIQEKIRKINPKAIN